MHHVMEWLGTIIEFNCFLLFLGLPTSGFSSCQVFSTICIGLMMEWLHTVVDVWPGENAIRTLALNRTLALTRTLVPRRTLVPSRSLDIYGTLDIYYDIGYSNVSCTPLAIDSLFYISSHKDIGYY